MSRAREPSLTPFHCCTDVTSYESFFARHQVRAQQLAREWGVRLVIVDIESDGAEAILEAEFGKLRTKTNNPNSCWAHENWVSAKPSELTDAAAAKSK